MLKSCFEVFAVDCKVLYHAVNVCELKPDKFDVLLLDLFNDTGDVLFPNSIFEVFHLFSLALIGKVIFGVDR